jgi:hypothetical protein
LDQRVLRPFEAQEVLAGAIPQLPHLKQLQLRDERLGSAELAHLARSADRLSPQLRVKVRKETGQGSHLDSQQVTALNAMAGRVLFH